MFVFGKKGLYSGKVIVFGINWLYFGKSGCIRENGLYSLKWLNSGKSGCFRENKLCSGKSCFIWAKW